MPILYAALAFAILTISAWSRSEPSIIAPVSAVPDFGMVFPADYRDAFTLYLVVDRVDATVRHIYAHPDAVRAARDGDSLPDGAQFVIETWDASRDWLGNIRRDADGRFITADMHPNVHVMEKRDDWTTDQLPSPIGVIDWNFGSFDARTLQPSDENRNDCLTCHDGGAFRRDFIFSQRLLNQYAQTDTTQYLYCHLPRRGNCIR
ncbi:MAG: cytochrome P460 family protein [Anaerolineae bacterium]